ncbi:MAG: RNA polymerase factor sigma-54, partial [Arenimonas sp.]|nr:RNA polymerase factor sigma-54 [Arenimonas sp.]
MRLTQRQGTRLTPQLQLAMRLLQCGRTELEHLIEDALAANPVLERVADDGPAHTGDEPLDHGPGHAENGEPPLPAETGAATGDEPDWHGIAEPVSLQSHLNAQLRLSPLGPRDRAIGEALIDGLDADGYCTAGFDDIRAACALQPAPDDAEIETVRHLIQRFDPL